ncbi:hypothetical protein DL240_00620 [Lujinxingia litoralis]|uniref:Lipoprotein n=1 Tax=Lujinxingia litoralis TaxID=2211119 RepID=A0A328C828_9DELT|nr:hypothetical protein [Lujinxingia litoralis]RAL24747.1 hypothetical protein DL240_00620 [Lujinxingia litoralis]
MTWIFPFPAALLFLIVLTGCGDADHDGHQHDSESPDATEEACLHAQDTPTLINAAASPEEALTPDIEQGHTLYEISLPESTSHSGQYTGYLRYDRTEPADVLLFTSSVIDVAVLDSTGAEQVVSTTAVDACAELLQSHRVALEAGSYTLSFGPGSEPTVSILIEAESHDHAHE